MDQQVGRYRVVGNLGKGAMGVVLLAEDPLLNRQVAIKTLDLAVDDPGQKSFLQERLLRDARAAAALTHANIVSIFDVVEQESRAYLVMEYVSGRNLAQVLAGDPLPDPSFATRVLREMAAALDYTHARGVIHRDVKPANVMLDEHGAVKIMDFGIARITDSRTSTPTGMVMGTIEYMAPEQVKGEGVDGRADQFSLAAVAYEMFTGKTVFGEHSFTTLAYKIVHEVAPTARTHRPSLPVGVDEVLARALRKNPAERYASCGAFAAALDRAFAGEVPPTGAPTQLMAPPVGKRRAMPATAAILALGALGAAALVWKPWTKSEAPPPTPPRQEAPVPAAVVKEPPATHKSAPPKPAPPAPPETTEPLIPPAALAAYRRGEELLRSDQFDAAAESFSKAIQLKPDYGAAYVGRAQTALRRNQADDAIRDATEAIKRGPRIAFAYTLRGRGYLRQNQNDAAMADFARSLELSLTAAALDGRGQVYLRRNDYQKAIADFTAAIQLQPEMVEAYANRRRAYLGLGDRPSARADFKKVQELNGTKKSGGR